MINFRIYKKTKMLKESWQNFSIKYERTRAISSLEFIENESLMITQKNLLSIFEGKFFDYSKPVALLERLGGFISKQ